MRSLVVGLMLVALLGIGLWLLIVKADECYDENGIVVAPISPYQRCEQKP